MSSFVDHQGWLFPTLIFTALVLSVVDSSIPTHPKEVLRMANNMSCNATFLQSSGRWAYRSVDELVLFWLNFSLPSSCVQSVSFSWFYNSHQLPGGKPIQVSANTFFTNYTIENISTADFGKYSFKVTGQTLQTFYITSVESCHDQVPNATDITPRQIRPSGSIVTIVCTFFGDSSATFTDIDWYHNGTFTGNDLDSKKFDDRKPRNIINDCVFNHSLTINNATGMESGSYMCLAVTADGVHFGTSLTTNLEIVGVPVISEVQQLPSGHGLISMQWKVAGYSNHTLFSVTVNDMNFTEYKYNICSAYDGSILYIVNISKSSFVPGSQTIMLCAQFDDEVIQGSPPFKNCSSQSTFTIKSSQIVYLSLCLLVLLVAIPIVIAIIIYYMVRRSRSKKVEVEIEESIHQPLLAPHATQNSFYDSIRSLNLTTPIVRAAQRLTRSMSIKTSGHKESDKNKTVFILYCKPKGSSGESHVDDVQALAECLNLGSHKFQCEFDGWYNEYVAVWSNWTIKMIKKADFVILVCTRQFYDILSQEMGQTFETCRGSVSSAAVTNLLTTMCHKFIPVFLNTKVKRDFIPPALLGTTAYEVNVKELDLYVTENSEKMGKGAAMRQYLEDNLQSMEGLISLLKHLRGEE